MIDKKFIKLVRAQIAAENFKKTSLARKCKVTRPQFSEMIHGARVMPAEVRQRLITQLRLKPHDGKIELCFKAKEGGSQ